MKRTIRLNSKDLHNIIRESFKRTLNEYVSMNHSEHNLDDNLDDKDFLEIVDRVVKIHTREEFDEKDLENIDKIEIEIADMIKDFVTDEALDSFGYKYGTTNYRRVASNVIQYIQTHMNEM